MSSKKCDLKVKELVQAINSYPGIQTIMSCGGHKNPKVTHSQVSENEFFVDFGLKILIPTKEAWQSLNEIARSISDDSIYGWYNSSKAVIKIEICEDESYIVYFRLRGHNGDPDSIAGAMLERQPEHFDSLQLETPVNQ